MHYQNNAVLLYFLSFYTCCCDLILSLAKCVHSQDPFFRLMPENGWACQPRQTHHRKGHGVSQTGICIVWQRQGWRDQYWGAWEGDIYDIFGHIELKDLLCLWFSPPALLTKYFSPKSAPEMCRPGQLNFVFLTNRGKTKEEIFQDVQSKKEEKSFKISSTHIVFWSTLPSCWAFL